ncbi:MAG: helix-turn-helix transcriptional regulator [Chloroflexi bacterium]|nr:helix-turn-helix transcriptional regulator [Chloroflexota bacterium]
MGLIRPTGLKRKAGAATGPGQTDRLVRFMVDVMNRRRVLPSQLAAQLGVSHATVGRWLAGKDLPNTGSCRRLAEFSGETVTRVLRLAGHLPPAEAPAPDYPDFREYARSKYPDELDEDLISLIEDLIERRRQRRYTISHQGMP